MCQEVKRGLLKRIKKMGEKPWDELLTMGEKEPFRVPLDGQNGPFGVFDSFNGSIWSPLQRTQATSEPANGLMVCTVDNAAFSAESLQWTCSGADMVQTICPVYTVVAGNVLKKGPSKEYVDNL